MLIIQFVQLVRVDTKEMEHQHVLYQSLALFRTVQIVQLTQPPYAMTVILLFMVMIHPHVLHALSQTVTFVIMILIDYVTLAQLVSLETMSLIVVKFLIVLIVHQIQLIFVMTVL